MVSTDAARIPVTVLTGFLGSGKTTLLNALLRRPELADTAVIVNEIGAVDVDRDLLAGAADDVVLLDSGCLCCAMLNSFRETLAALYERRARGELPPFRRVVVETTGLADPAPILQTLLRDSFVTGFFRLHRLVTTVDAVHGETELDEHPECQVQVAMADRLVVTKTDLVGGAVPASLLERLATANPAATIAMAQGVIADPDILLGDGDGSHRAAFDRPESRGRFFAAPVTARHTAAIATESFVIDRPATWSGLAGWMDAAREFFGVRMLRCKGLLFVAEAGRPVVVQGVQGVFAKPVTLAAWPGEDHRSRLVCISRGIEPGLVATSLRLLHAEAGTYRPATIDELRTTP